MKRGILLAISISLLIILSGCGVTDSSSAINSLNNDLGYKVTCIEENYEAGNYGNYLLEDNAGIRFSYVSQTAPDGSAYTIDNYQARYLAERISNITNVLNENNLEYEVITSNDYFKNTELDEIVIYSDNLNLVLDAVVKILNENKYPITKNTRNCSIVPSIYLDAYNTKINFLYKTDVEAESSLIMEEINSVFTAIDDIYISGISTNATAYFNKEYNLEIDLSRDNSKNRFNIEDIFIAANIDYEKTDSIITYKIKDDAYKICFNKTYGHVLFYKNNELILRTILRTDNGYKLTYLSVSEIENLFNLEAIIEKDSINFKQ